MNTPVLRRLAGLVLCVALMVSAGAAESAVPFRSIGFEAASAAAAKEGKLVFIDFYTTWCEPCKRLDSVTWSDAAVGKLVGEKAVALKLDAEKEGRDLAKRYKIEAYPTLLLLKPDGTEVDRLIGFSEPAKFMASFSASVAGKSTLALAFEAVAQASPGHDTVKARYDLGKILASSGREEEALQEYLWCYDKGMVAVSSFVGVRNSFLVSSIAALGQKYPPALDALRERRDRAEEKMLASSQELKAPADFAALNGALKEDARTLQAFESLRDGDPRRRALSTRVFDLLVKEKRYSEAAGVRSAEEMEQAFERNLATMARMAVAKRPPGVPDTFPQFVVRTTAAQIEVLIGSDQVAAGRTLAKRLLDKVDGSDATRELLRAAAIRAGQATALTGI